MVNEEINISFIDELNIMNIVYFKFDYEER
jgi:hypothetical protein